MYFLSGRVMSEFFLLWWTCTSFALKNTLFLGQFQDPIYQHTRLLLSTFETLFTSHNPGFTRAVCLWIFHLGFFFKSKWISETCCVLTSTGQIILQCCQEFICMGEWEAYFSVFFLLGTPVLIKLRPFLGWGLVTPLAILQWIFKNLAKRWALLGFHLFKFWNKWAISRTMDNFWSYTETHCNRIFFCVNFMI